MYENYWQLNWKPFENGADSRFYYPAESHQAALLKLRYAVESRSSGALLAGASGLGKTLVADMLHGMLGPEYSPFVRIVFPQMSTADLLAYLADDFDGGKGQDGDFRVQTSVRRIERFLAGNAEQRRHAVLVIDEAHLLEDQRTFDTLRLLLNFQWNGQGGTHAVALGPTGDPSAAVAHALLGRAAGSQVPAAPVFRGGDGQLRRTSFAGCRREANDYRTRSAAHLARAHAGRCQTNQPPLRSGAVDRVRRGAKIAFGRAFRVGLAGTGDGGARVTSRVPRCRSRRRRTGPSFLPTRHLQTRLPPCEAPVSRRSLCSFVEWCDGRFRAGGTSLERVIVIGRPIEGTLCTAACNLRRCVGPMAQNATTRNRSTIGGVVDCQGSGVPPLRTRYCVSDGFSVLCLTRWQSGST